jgi:NADP-dependent 3-hydroxy acid dehydrogenase YdfG
MSTGHEPAAEEEPVVWVVGAGSGMGRACALDLAEHGRRVAVSGRRSEALDAVATAVALADHEAIALPLDVGDAAAVERAHAAILEQWGRLDALVLASGMNVPERSWQDLRMSELEQVVDTNLLGVARIMEAALPSLRRRGGVVVVLSSIAAWRFSPGSGVAYSASKTALGALCQSLNHDEAANGVRACHLCPGDVNTDFLEHRPRVPDAAARSAMLQPDDVARVVRFVLDSPPHVRIDELVLTPAPVPALAR